jgi:hypothetical protein
MGFSRKVNDRIRGELGKRSLYCLVVGNVHPYKLVVSAVGNRVHVGQVSRIGQLVQIHKQDVRMFGNHQIEEIAPNEASATGDQHGFPMSGSP